MYITDLFFVDKLAGQLSDELSGAMAGLGGADDADNYDFGTDFKWNFDTCLI